MAALDDSQELHWDSNSTIVSIDKIGGEGHSHYSLGTDDFEAVIHLLSNLLEFYFDLNCDPTLERTESGFIGFIWIRVLILREIL